MPKIIATGSCMSRLGLQQVKAGTFFETQCGTAIVSSNCTMQCLVTAEHAGGVDIIRVILMKCEQPNLINDS